MHALDEPAQRQLAEADPQRLATGEPPILVDEWQRGVPASWDVVRRAVWLQDQLDADLVDVAVNHHRNARLPPR